MRPEFETIFTEVAPKKKGYLVIRACPPGDLDGLVRRETERLFEAGAEHVYLASTDPGAPLEDGMELGNVGLRFCHDMLGMTRDLGPDRPRPEGRLTLEPLTRETGAAWLGLLNRGFFYVPNSATNDEDDLKDFLEGPYRCGFALLAGETVGVYECGFKKEHPEIGSIALTEESRGRGLGRELLLSVMDLLAGLGHPACWLQVSTANATAHALYRSVGFRQTELLSRWYEAAYHD